MGSHLVIVSTLSLAFSDRVVEAHEPVLVQALRRAMLRQAQHERGWGTVLPYIMLYDDPRGIRQDYGRAPIAC